MSLSNYEKREIIWKLLNVASDVSDLDAVIMDVVKAVTNDVDLSTLRVSSEKPVNSAYNRQNDLVLPTELAIAKGTSFAQTVGNLPAVPIGPQKVLAIKLYRERTGLGLRESKEAIERAMDD